MVSPSTRRGFSLTEILVVVVLIVILATILLVGGDYVYTHAMRTNCQHNMEQIWHACQMYATNRGVLPPAWDYNASKAWYENQTLVNYLSGGAVVGCPVEYVAPGSGEAGQDLGMPTEEREALLDTLRWLRRVQDGKGAWDDTSSLNEYTQTGCFGPTGLALLAFLCAGRTDTSDPEFAPTVRTAIEFLMKSQSQFDGTSSEGRVPCGKLAGTTNDSKYMYGHGICTLALCDAAKMMPTFTAEVDGKQRALRQAAQKAVDFLVSRMGPYGGFNYTTVNQASRTDLSVGAWCYQAIYSAMTAGITPTGTTWDALRLKINAALDAIVPPPDHQYYPQSPYVYTQDSSGVTSYNYTANGEKSPYRMTAVSLLSRLYMGQSASHPHVAAQLAFLTRTKDGQTDPEHIRQAKLALGTTYDVNSYDIYTIYYLSLALHHVGASKWSEWVEGAPPRFLGYPDHLMALRVDKTTSTSDDKWYSGTVVDKGSWHYNLGAWGDRGKIYPTALAAMCNELAVADYLPGSKWCIAGAHSYGYNKLLGIDRRTPAADTIVFVDYARWGVDASDPSEFLIPRHGGKVNVLFADGRVEALADSEIVDAATKRIRIGLLTLAPGD